MFTLPVTGLLLVASAFQWYHRQVAMHNDTEITAAHAIGAALSLYLSENQDTLPPADRWETNLDRLAGGPSLHIAGAPFHDGAGFAMNSLAAGLSLKRVHSPHKFIFAYECTTSSLNAVGAFKDAAGLHGKQHPLVVFADGTVARLSSGRFMQAITASSAQLKE
jgi:hypothetical protein